MPKRTLSAIFSSDINGFKKQMHDDEARAVKRLDHYNAIIKVIIKKFGGSDSKTRGDLWIVRFNNAADAVDCSREAQGLFCDYNNGKTAEERLPVRIGIHIGDIVLKNGDLLGGAVHVAEQLRARTRPGGVLISREVFSLLSTQSARTFRKGGAFPINGLAATCETFQYHPSFDAGTISEHGISLSPAKDIRPEQSVENVKAPDPLSDYEKRAGTHNKKHEALPHKAVEQSEPITRAILSIDHRVLMFEKIGGMRIIERQLFTLKKAGIKKIWLSTSPLKEKAIVAMRWPKDLDVHWSKWNDEEDGEVVEKCDPPYANVSGDHFIRLDTLREIFTTLHKKPTAYRDPNNRGVIQISLHPSERFLANIGRPMPQDSYLRLSLKTDKGYATRWLLQEARKKTDSFMAKHFDRSVSLALTRRLLNTRIRPNHMTIFSSCIGAAGALMLAAGSHPAIALGALTIWLHTLLDGCDGELARLRFEESRFGGVLDFWGDNIVHFLLFSCLGIGLYRTGSGAVFLGLGILAAVTGLLSALLVYRHSVERAEKKKDEGPFFKGLEDILDNTDGLPAGKISKALASIEHALSQRDFIYLFVILALANRTDLFLWAAGIGTPLFLLTLISLRTLSKNR